MLGWCCLVHNRRSGKILHGELKCVKLGEKRFQIMRGDEKFISEYSGTRLSWCMARNKIIKELSK